MPSAIVKVPVYVDVLYFGDSTHPKDIEVGSYTIFDDDDFKYRLSMQIAELHRDYAEQAGEK